MSTFRYSTVAAGLLLAFLVTSPCRAQGAAPDSTTLERSQHRWGVGAQLGPILGPSVRYALTKRLTVQAAGLPFLIGGETVAGARLLYKLFVRPKYNFFVSGGGTVFIDTKNRNFLTGEDEGVSTISIVFATLGGEYRFAGRLGLAGGLGFGYLHQSSSVVDNSGLIPILDLGLHFYF